MVEMGRLGTARYGKIDVEMLILRALAFDTYRVQILLNKTIERQRTTRTVLNNMTMWKTH